MTGYRITLVALDDIRPTEEIDAAHVASLAGSIEISGVWTHPIFVDDEAQALMDGHHRFQVARQLGLSTVPAVVLSYDDPRVALHSWRPGERYTPDMLRRMARAGELLPRKSTRHTIAGPLPRCRVPLALLRGEGTPGAEVDAATPQPNREQLLAPFYHAFAREAGLRGRAADRTDLESAESHAPHARLREMLGRDPAMAALLPGAAARMAPGGIADAPFRLKKGGLLLLPPTLLEEPAALSVAARWGLEAAHAAKAPAVGRRWLISILRHGARLVAAAPPQARNLILDSLPADIGRELSTAAARYPSERLLAWQASMIEGARFPSDTEEGETPVLSLDAPLEDLLVAGGDSRLLPDTASGFNRYGVPPRPRPEAVHFSSSTASAISDYGFMFCDALRRDLLTAVLEEGADERELRRRAVSALGRGLTRLLGIAPDTVDVTVTPSGTDAELTAVMVALAGAGERPLTNILISPAETGRGVKFAGAGLYFDDLAGTGAVVSKKAPAWPGAEIEVCEVPIRCKAGRPLDIAEIDRAFLEAGRAALAEGRHVLAHALASSKTGLSAPSLAAVEELVAMAPDRVDVVVDACQMRTEFDALGALAERGWMLQISGSKFLTGPPFSGALVLPAAFRARLGPVAERLAAAPGVSRAEDWGGWWSDRLPDAEGLPPPSFGPVFRWFPALLEAHLLMLLPRAFRRWAFERFREAVLTRLADSKWLVPIDTDEVAATDADQADELSRLSIVSFQVLGETGDGSLKALDEESCRTIFEMLNEDVSGLIGRLSPTERVLAAQRSHIGQPVRLCGGDEEVTILRMVLGARFFTFVGHSGPGSIKAALESEISDALRAIGKLELLAERWWRVREMERRAG